MSRINGRSLLATFDGEVAARDAAVQRAEAEVAAQERLISAANADREAAYTELAELYSADDGTLASAFGEISRRLQKIFDEKMHRRGAINTLIDQAAALIANLQGQVPVAQRAEQDAQGHVAETRRLVEAELAADPAFLSLKRDAEALQEAAEQSEVAHGRIRAECESKLKAFTSHPLFRYLVSVKFGTPDYTRGRLVEAGDRWVAERVSWHRNYSSFAMLSELPGFAEKRAQASRKKTELAATAVALHVQAREIALGVVAARNTLASATQAVAQLQAQIAKLEAQRAMLIEERQQIDAGSDPFRQRAKAEMKAFLAAHPTSDLKAKAKATATPRDNELAEEIERAEHAINDGRKAVKALMTERAEAVAQHTRAVSARRQFSSDYTGSYDQFDSRMDFGALLLGYIAGSTSQRSMWSSLNQHHHDATPTYSYSSDDSSPANYGGDSGNDFSTGGGDSGSDFSTGGGDGGDSFSTGGGD